MDKQRVLDIAQYLYEAEIKQNEIEKITITKAPRLTVAEAYQIQDQLTDLKLKDGHTVFAPKLGLTSRAKMKQMKVDDPIYGYVFDYMVVENEGTFSINDYIHARVEPEIAVVMKNELKGPGITIEDVKENIAYVVSSLEILDSRYIDYDFTHPDVIADNTSARGAVYDNTKVRLNEIDLINEEAVLKVNGEVKAKGTGAAVLGNPLETIVFLANELGEKGKAVPVGVPIMTGGMTSAVPVKAEDLIEVDYSTLGKIQVKATP
jgi:2-oxo-3-hexenedioate decarboxylase